MKYKKNKYYFMYDKPVKIRYIEKLFKKKINQEPAPTVDIEENEFCEDKHYKGR